jgi:hypothetical protein
LESAVELMRDLFNGYHFPGVTQDGALFNSQQCLFFLQKLAKKDSQVLRRDLLVDDKWKDMPVSRVISKVVDKNSLPSDNVFGVLGRSPISNADSTLLAAGSVFCDEEALDTSYRLHDMLVPHDADDTDEVLLRSRAFMYAHGMVTLGSTDIDGKRRLVVPNKIADTVYFKYLKSAIGMREHDVNSLFDAPSSEKLQSFFQQIVDQVNTPHDNYFSEGAFQAEIESFVRALLHVSPRPGLHLFVESNHADGKGYSDMIFFDERRNVLIVLELQRIRLQFLLDHLGQKASRGKLVEWEQAVNQLTDDEVLESQWRAVNGEFMTIRQSLEEKKEQVQLYVRHLQRERGFKTSSGDQITLAQNPSISLFAVVQVGRRILVEDASI